MQSYEQNIELIKKAQNGDKQAKEELISQNYPLVKSIIRRYVNKGVEYDDLFQLGCVGFMKAVNNFNPDFDVHFSTYAVPMIAGEVKRFLRDDGYIKVSRALKMLSLKIRQFIKTKEEKGNTPTIDEIAKEFSIDPQEVAFALDSNRYPVSIFAPLDSESEDGATIAEKIEDESKSNNLDHFVLKQLIQGLSERDRKIIILRYYKDKTQNEVAKIMGVSQVQVSRIENKILNNFKKSLKN